VAQLHDIYDDDDDDDDDDNDDDGKETFRKKHSLFLVSIHYQDKHADTKVYFRKIVMNIGLCFVDIHIRPFSSKWKTLSEVLCVSGYQKPFH